MGLVQIKRGKCHMGYTVEDIGGIPEECAGLDIDWKRYVPTGGYGWQVSFRNEKMPRITEVVEDLRKEVSRLRGVVSRMNDLKNKMQVATEFFRDLKEFLKEDGGLNDETSAFFDAYEGVFGLNPENSKIHFNTKSFKERTAEVQANLDYAETLAVFFDCDNRFDKLLYAMHTAEVKYRTKIFRTVWRLFQEQKERLEKINVAKCMAKEELDGEFAQGISEMNQAYAACAISLKQVKKGIDKEGSSFWSRRMDSPEMLALFGNIQIKHSEWK